jgi:subtilisin family serine protease
VTPASVTAIALAALAILPASAGGAPRVASDGWFEHAGNERSSQPEPRGHRFVPGEVLVRFRNRIGPSVRSAALHRAGASASYALDLPGLRLVRLRGGAVRSAITAFERQPGVVYAQPNYRYRLAALPNDPRFGEQWGLNNTGQAVEGSGGVPDADVDATDAWTLTTGQRSTLIAIADSGIAYDNPDLAANLWRNPGESGGGKESNGRDDDRNGYVDDWRGWDFVDRDNDPRDLNGHGTHVAGIVGARGNNNFGTTGIDWQVGLMGLRVADATGLVSDVSIVSAFDYAAAKGARIVNASFVSSAYSAVLRDAIRRHPRTLFVAAAGNGDPDGIGDDDDVSPQYPCSFDLVNLVCVAASDQSDHLTRFSNFGRRSVDLAAPGSNVLSATPAYATVFADGFETDLAGIWVTGGVNDSWGRITTVAHGGSFSLSDSPGTTYQNNTDSFVALANPIDMRGQQGCRVQYALRLSTEPSVDHLLLEASTDGATWTAISDSSGSSGGAFFELTDDLSRFDGAAALHLRFRLVTNASVVSDGAQLDDVAVRCLGSSYNGGELAYNDGTSMAAPHVTGVAALVLSRYPKLGVGAVVTALLRGVDRPAGLSGRVASDGRLNALGALRQARKLVPSLRLGGASRQRAGRSGAIVLLARCKHSCTVAATGRLAIGRSARGLALKRTSRALAGRKRKRLVLKLTRRTRAKVRRALARGRRVSASVEVTATDRRGSTARAKRKIRVRR